MKLREVTFDLQFMALVRLRVKTFPCGGIKYMHPTIVQVATCLGHLSSRCNSPQSANALGHPDYNVLPQARCDVNGILCTHSLF